MAVGAGAAVWTMNKVNEMARGLTPDGLADSAARGAISVGDAVRSFTGEVRTGMARREIELNRQLGLDGSVLAVENLAAERAAAERGLDGRPVLRGLPGPRAAGGGPAPARPLPGTPRRRPALPRTHDHDHDRAIRPGQDQYDQKEGH